MLLGERLLDDVGGRLLALWGAKRVAVVTQAVIERTYGKRLRSSLRSAGISADVLRIPSGERYKNLDTVSRLYDRLIRSGYTRDDAIVAFGGGTVGDTAGFVAATYLRGLPFVQIPTTLVAQIDSAIGAKVGVNHPRGKNLIGAMYRPRAVWIDPAVLSTLPARELRAGMFELLKYGFIGVPALFKRFETDTLELGSRALSQSIADGVQRKLAVVRADESETGLRRVLNFGHTIGHGLEAAGSYRSLRHGEAVGWGMIAAVRLSYRAGKLSARLARRMEDVVRKVGPLPSLGRLSPTRVMTAIAKDKKRTQEGLRFILPVALGRVEIVERFPVDDINWVLADIGVGG